MSSEALTTKVFSQKNDLKTRSENFSFSGGVDWLEYPLLVHFKMFDEVKKALDEMQKEHKKEGAHLPGVYKGDDGFTFTVRPFGEKIGQSMIYAPWVINHSGAKIKLLPLNAEEAINLGFNVIVQFTGLACLQHGLQGCLEIEKKFLETIGGEVLRRSKPIRVDECLDLIDIPVTKFQEAYRKGLFICRANSIINFEEHKSGGKDSGLSAKDTGLKAGKSSVVLRIYDKPQELKIQGSPEKVALMCDLRYNGEMPSCASRIEFQIRSAFLKQYNIKTMEDYLKKRSSIVKYLTEEWLKIATKSSLKSIKQNHYDRVKISNLWKNVQKAFTVLCGEGSKMKKQAKEFNPDTTQLNKQALGVLIASQSARGILPKNDNEVIEDFKRILAENKTEFYRRSEIKFFEAITRRNAKIKEAI